jgi:peptide/nickel transport system substrate-binding protein
VNKHRRVRAALIAAGLAASVCLTGLQAASSATTHKATPAIKRGGTVIIVSTGATSLDPISPLWPTGSSYGYQIYGALFDPTGTSGSTLAPDLATGYSFSNGYKTLTVTLRPGVKFQDGTSFNAKAVAYNIERDAGTSSDVSQYFTDLTSVTTPSKYTVVIHLSHPDTNLATVLADTNVTYIVSPAAVESEGATQFGLFPIGAGPFKITTNNSTEQILTAWKGYYASKTRYLNSLEYLNDGVNPTTAYQALASGAVQSFTMIGLNDPPTVLQEAESNPALTTVKGSDLVYTFLPVNTNKPPFNNPLAREAIDYCTDRAQIAQYVQGGFANPAPILAGTSEQYYPGSPGSVKSKLAAANKLQPYQYNVAEGTALVKQLGGLSFQFNELQGQTQVIATALAQQWAQCGITATPNIVGFGQVFGDYATGNFQLSTQISGGIFNGAIYVPLYSVPTAADDAHGFNSPTITNLLNATNLSSNDKALTGIWSRIWGGEDKLAVNIPILSADNYYVDSKCLKGLGFIEAGVIFKSAYYTCTPS